jgi:Peptidase S46
MIAPPGVERMNRLALPVLLVLNAPAPVGAGEGMWTLDNPPLSQLKKQFDFEPDAGWLERVRLASVRFMDGGSGGFVSREGLMVTNHHVALNCIQNVSSAQKDLIAGGFPAASRGSELACPGYEVNVLVGSEEVTSRVQGAAAAAKSDRESGELRRRAVAGLEGTCLEQTGLRCEVVELYGGGEVWLYRYKKYTDVRLVFAPEESIAFFGGDPDNFTFPRHDLDVAFFRAYENGAPVRPASFFNWSTGGAGDGDLVFALGNPGSTSRLKTTAQLRSERDVVQPTRLKLIDGMLAALRAFSALSPENARRAVDDLRTLENSQKARRGFAAALRDEAAMAKKAAEEEELRAKVAADPELAKTVGDPWSAIAEATAKLDARYTETRLAGYIGSELLGIAGLIVQYVVETRKPNGERLPPFRDSALASLENELYSTAPIHKDLEEVKLTERLRQSEETLGRDHPFVRAVLGARTPAEVAREAVGGTRLDDAEARRALVKGGPAAVEKSSDTMIALARKIDPFDRAITRFQEDEIEPVLTRAGEKLALARFKAHGRSSYPDATFTLRLSYGTVASFPASGTIVAPRTTFHGLYDRWASWGGKPPWNLPERWVEKKGRLDLVTPLNFVTTNDTVGGSSGSPVINKGGELVGIVFDGNIESLAGDYYYDESINRTVAVDARGILEALRHVYDAESLVQELLGS